MGRKWQLYEGLKHLQRGQKTSAGRASDKNPFHCAAAAASKDTKTREEGGLLLLGGSGSCFSISLFVSLFLVSFLAFPNTGIPPLAAWENNCSVPSAGTLLSCSLSHFQTMKSWREKLVWESHLKQVLLPEGSSSHNRCYQACQKYFEAVKMALYFLISLSLTILPPLTSHPAQLWSLGGKKKKKK